MGLWTSICSTYHRWMSSVLMFSTIWCIGKGFIAVFIFTHVRSFPSVWSFMCLQVFQPGVSFVAAWVLEKICASVEESQLRCNKTLLEYVYTRNYCSYMRVHARWKQKKLMMQNTCVLLYTVWINICVMVYQPGIDHDASALYSITYIIWSRVIDMYWYMKPRRENFISINVSVANT